MAVCGRLCVGVGGGGGGGGGGGSLRARGHHENFNLILNIISLDLYMDGVHTSIL